MLRLRARNSAEKWKKTVNQLTLEDLKEYREFHNRTEGKSEKTIKWCNDVLRLVEHYLESEGLSTFIMDIGEPEVRAFIHHLQNKTKWVKRNGRAVTERLSSEGVQNRLRALKAFFNWFHRQGYTEEHRLAGMRNIRVQKKVVEVLTDEEIGRILATCDVREHRGARTHAIITLMLDTGLRFSEVITLEESQVDIDDGCLKVLGKGNKERIVPFGSASQKTLWRYHKLFRPEPVDTDSFFLTEEGYQFTQDGFKSLFQRVAQRSGIPRLHAHLLRHTFATKYLMAGGDIFSLQQILGHTSLEMVRRYVTLASQHVAVQHRKFSPMDRVVASFRRRSA
jgi:integrase/recombinase XerC/integrase/recombinase XerD